jgi:hypothetical protein
VTPAAPLRRVALPALLAIVTAACAERIAQRPQRAPAPETLFVRQPALTEQVARLEVVPRAIAFDAIGDTARLHLPSGTECVSGNDRVARAEPAGLVRAVGNGAAQVLCWLEDRRAFVPVRVAQRIARVEVRSGDGLAMRKSGDSLQLALAHTDRLGQPVQGVRASWASLAPGVVRVNAVTGVAVGLVDSGTARVVGAAAGLADTVTLEIGIKSQASRLLRNTTRSARTRAVLARTSFGGARPASLPGAAGAASQSQSRGITFAAEQQGPAAIGARPPAAADSLFRDPMAGLLGRTHWIEPTLLGGFAEHRVSQGVGLEKTSGPLFGGAMGLALGGALSLRLQFLTGRLKKDTVTVLKDRSIAAGRLEAGIQISPWLTVLVGGEARRYEVVGTERWLIGRAGAEANVSLGGGPLRGIARIFVLPLISIANNLGTATAPSSGLASEIGLGLEGRHVAGSLLYSVERYSFPSSTGRKEQFGALLFRVGYKLGW